MKYLPFLFLLLFLSCEPKTVDSSQVTTAPLPTSLPEDFNSFYEQFHADTAFQMAHIQWPLPGIPSSDSLRQLPGFGFEREDWTPHRRFDPTTSGYKSDFQPLSKDLIVERITDVQGRYGLERRWYRNSTSLEWELIFYQEAMPLGN